MLSLHEVTHVLTGLSDNLTDIDHVQQNEIWSQVSAFQLGNDLGWTCSPADIDAFSDVVRRLCNRDLDDETTDIAALLEKGLLKVLTAVFESAKIVCDTHQNTGLLMNVMDLVCVASDIGSKAKSMLAEMFGSKFLEEMTSSENRCYTIEVGKCVNLLLERCPTSVREILINDAKVAEKLHEAASMIYTAGDYELQVGIIECLFRFIHKKMRNTYTAKFFQDSATCESFLQITDSDFETDCRIFLNNFNSSIKSKLRVISVACDAAHMGAKELKKPSDPKYPHFWVDFNGGVGRISLFSEQDSDSQGEESIWETVSFWRKDIKAYKLDEESKPIVLILYLRRSLEEVFPSQCSGQKETSALFTFDPGLKDTVQEALIMTYGPTLDWKHVKDQICKASKAITPVRLKLHNKTHPEVLTKVLNQEMKTDVNKQSGSLQQTGTTKKTGATPVHQKISVPAQPMSTPARISLPKAQKQSHTTPTASMAAADSTESKEQTPNKNMEAKEFQTPVGKRTRAGGKVKTPLALEPTSTKSFRRKEKKQLQQNGRTETDGGGGKLKEDGKSTMSDSEASKSVSTAAKKSTVLSKPVDPMDIEIETIPDSLPLMKDVAVTEITLDLPEKEHPSTGNITREEDKPRKSFGDSGISLHDHSSFEQEKDKSRADEPEQFHKQPSDYQQQKKEEKLEIPSNRGRGSFSKFVTDKCSGEISNDSAESCLPTPRRSNRLASYDLHPVASSQSSLDSQENKPKCPKGKARKGKQSKKKQTTKIHSERTSSLKGEAEEKTKKSKANYRKNYNKEICDTQMSVNSLEEFSVTFPKPEKAMPSGNQKLFFNRTGKKTVYESSAEVCAFKAEKDPYNFDAYAESNASSRYKCKGAKQSDSKTNKIFTSRNKKSGSNATGSKQILGKTKRENNLTETALQDKEIHCFGFDSPEIMDSPILLNFAKSDNPPSKSAQLRSPLDIQFKDISSTLEGRENVVTPKSCPEISEISGKWSKIVTVKKIQEKMQERGQKRRSKKRAKPSDMKMTDTRNKSTSLHVLEEQDLFGGNEEMSRDPLEHPIDDHISSPELACTPVVPKPVKVCPKTKVHKPEITKAKKREPVETESSDDNIVLQFSDICKHIVASSVAKDEQRGRRCKKTIAYKDLSDSEVEVEEDIDDQFDSDQGSIQVEYREDIQSSFDVRSEISWLASQRKQRKPPMKTYHGKVFHMDNQSTPVIRDDLELETGNMAENFNFESELIDMDQASRMPKSSKSEKKQTRHKKPKQGSKETPLELGEDVDNPSLMEIQLRSKFLSVCLTPLKVDPDVPIIGGQDGQGRDDSPSFDLLECARNMLGYNVEDQDDDFDLKSDVSRKRTHRVRTPLNVIPDLDIPSTSRFDEEKDLLAPAGLRPEVLRRSLLNTRLMTKDLKIVEEDTGRRGFVSGPSSTKRAPKSALKRRYENIVEESEESDKSDVIISPDIPASKAHEVDSSLKPRKLFRSNIKERSEPLGMKGVTRGEYKVPSRSRSISSEESVSQIEGMGDMGLQTGMTAFINTFDIDMQNRMKEKQARLDSLTRVVTKTTHKHMAGIWEEQVQNRMQLMDDLKDNVLLELLELEKDVANLKEAEDQAMEFFKKQLLVLQNCRNSQEQRLRNLRRLQTAYDRKTEDMSSSERQKQASLREVLKREISTLHKRLLQDTQQQEMGKFRRSLQNLF